MPTNGRKDSALSTSFDMAPISAVVRSPMEHDLLNGGGLEKQHGTLLVSFASSQG